jgi:predicted dehydrogenase
VYTEIPHIKLVGVCDIDAVRAEQLAQNHRAQAFTDYKTLIPQADIVSIATPTSTHFEVAKFAITHNKHVLIEKPITNDLRQARKLIRLAADSASSCRSDTWNASIPLSLPRRRSCASRASSNATA